MKPKAKAGIVCKQALPRLEFIQARTLSNAAASAATSKVAKKAIFESLTTIKLKSVAYIIKVVTGSVIMSMTQLDGLATFALSTKILHLHFR